jgi:phenylalanyl-tRNA synthetase beta chain
MKVSMNWLNEYVDVDDYKLLETKFNLMSQEVESLYKLVEASNLVIGHVLTCEKHPDANKLNITTVNVGQVEPLQIICGAPNVAEGQKVIVALVGAVLPGDFKIKKAKIRGVESSGMICSLDELGVKEFDSKETGIYVLGDDAVVGEDPLKYLGLDDYVLDLDLTANRPDLLSMEGVAYDTACMLNKEIKTKSHKYDKNKKDNYLKIFTDTAACTAYYGQVIENIKIKESPNWMKARLLAAGVRPISNVVDITNYVMLEYGQPLHAFDFDKLNSDTILVRMAKTGEKLKTLDDQERILNEDDIIITDGKNPIALAGVMGGFDTEVDDNTVKILLESAMFNPLNVRKTSGRLNLKSEASSRFEKGIDPNKMVKALDYATELFIKYADGEVVGDYSFFDTTSKKPVEVELKLKKLNHVTGHDFQTEEVEEILKRLRFKFKVKDRTFIVEIPTRRQNTYGYQDLIEEIVRIYGYDKIPTSVPKTPTTGYLTKLQKLRRVIRSQMTDLGFNETVTYSLVSDEQATEFDIEDKSVVEILNPLHKEKRTLRHSLIPSLLEVLTYNKSRKISDVFLFEIGRSYEQGNETELVSGLMHGLYSVNLWQGKKEEADFYLLKGVIESMLNRLKITDYEIVKAKNNLDVMHPGIYAELYINNEYAGLLGKLHPEKEHKLNINKTFVFELKLDVINENYNLDLVMQEIPKYPAVSRDLALVIDRNVLASQLIEEVKKAGKKTLKSVEIFDLYEGDNIDKDKKSIALSLVLQSNEKTLETKEVDVVIERILKHLETELNASLR